MGSLHPGVLCLIASQVNQNGIELDIFLPRFSSFIGAQQILPSYQWSSHKPECHSRSSILFSKKPYWLVSFANDLRGLLLSGHLSSFFTYHLITSQSGESSAVPCSLMPCFLCTCFLSAYRVLPSRLHHPLGLRAGAFVRTLALRTVRLKCLTHGLFLYLSFSLCLLSGPQSQRRVPRGQRFCTVPLWIPRQVSPRIALNDEHLLNE